MSEHALTPRITAVEVAVILGRSQEWVSQAARSGELPAEKIGGRWRFNPDDLEVWLASKRNRPAMTMTALSAKRQATKRRWR